LKRTWDRTLDESKIYFYDAAQEEALAQGIVPLLAPALSSWQPESQAAAAQVGHSPRASRVQA